MAIKESHLKTSDINISLAGSLSVFGMPSISGTVKLHLMGDIAPHLGWEAIQTYPSLGCETPTAIAAIAAHPDEQGPTPNARGVPREPYCGCAQLPFRR